MALPWAWESKSEHQVQGASLTIIIPGRVLGMVHGSGVGEAQALYPSLLHPGREDQ